MKGGIRRKTTRLVTQESQEEEEKLRVLFGLIGTCDTLGRRWTSGIHRRWEERIKES